MPATGPTSEIGKAKMRDNPLKHGLTAKHIVIPGESAEEYTALRADLFESYQPVTAGEEILTNQIVEAYWRLMRARKVEADFWKKAMGTDQDLGRVFREHADEHNRMHRYITTIQRDYYKAIRELQKEQSIRNERYNAQQAPHPGSVSQNGETLAPEQSVSQNPELPSATHPESVSQNLEQPTASRDTSKILASRSSLLNSSTCQPLHMGVPRK